MTELNSFLNMLYAQHHELHALHMKLHGISKGQHGRPNELHAQHNELHITSCTLYMWSYMVCLRSNLLYPSELHAQHNELHALHMERAAQFKWPHAQRTQYPWHGMHMSLTACTCVIVPLAWPKTSVVQDGGSYGTGHERRLWVSSWSTS